ncbi:MAG: hypothetical protein PVG07_12865 [Acidobacteriota bacterium]|jgi:hypothetical protein
MNRRTSIILGIVALASILALPASASTFVAMDEQELVAASATVVEGRVLEVHSFWNADGTAILTEATVRVTDVVAGRAADVVTVRTFGGRVGDHVIEAHGFPTFQQGERALLFLQGGADGTLRVTGYQLGHYRVRSDERGRKLAVPTMEAGVQLLRKDGTPAPRPQAVELDGFKDVVRSFAARTPNAIVK